MHLNYYTYLLGLLATPSLADTVQQIAVASYIDPAADLAAWNRLIEYPVEKLPILLANIVNGPDYAVDSEWADVISRASAAGKKVLGYVRTGYLSLSDQKYVTRLGSTELADWIAQIEEDIDMWYTLYGDYIGGIFFDEGWPSCGDNNEYADLYKYINDYTKRAHPGAYTILNPGGTMASCFEDTMDTLLTFESDYTTYTSSYTANTWVPTDPRKLWHIVYNVPESALADVIALANERGVGYLQLTDDVLPNPYDALPSDTYMQSMLDAVNGGSLANANASDWASGASAGAISGLSISSSDYSSVTLSWNAASGALGYYVYSGDAVVVSVPGTMTMTTIGGLQPGSSYTISVRAVGSGGTTGTASSTLTVKTTSLPDGLAISNLNATAGTSSTTYTADVLIPYNSFSLYIWDSVACDFTTDPGWTINFVVDNYICAQYMSDGSTLYRYTGTSAGAWSWSSVGSVTASSSGYTYTWTLPLGTSTTDTTKFVVQAQGYNPLINVFEPNPADYE